MILLYPLSNIFKNSEEVDRDQEAAEEEADLDQDRDLEIEGKYFYMISSTRV